MRTKTSISSTIDSLELLSSKVASKLEGGNFKGIVKLACAVKVLTNQSLDTEKEAS